MILLKDKGITIVVDGEGVTSKKKLVIASSDLASPHFMLFLMAAISLQTIDTK